MLRTDPHPVQACYALELPGVAKQTIDLDYTLAGRKEPWIPQRGPDALVAGAKPAATGVTVSQGNWLRGRDLFMNEGKCATCHQLRGEGRAVGPDLSNLGHRDVASIIRDIHEPSATINPDHVAYELTMHDGERIAGVLHSEAGGTLRVFDASGKDRIVKADNVQTFRPLALSLMPTGYDKTITGPKLEDLITFLRTDPPSMPKDLENGAPPPRTRAEVDAILKGAPNPAEKTRQITLVLVAGPKDHGKGEHDYPAWQKAWSRLLAMSDGVKVETAWEWPSAGQFAGADAIAFFQHGSWSPEKAKAIDAFLARGGGLTYIHWAVDGSPDGPDFAKRIGLAAPGGSIKYRHGQLDMVFNTKSKHPIVRNFDRARFIDESYWQLVGDRSRISVLGTQEEEGEAQPLFWCVEPGKPAGGRVFVSILGHYSWTFDDPLFRTLLLRGIAWSAHEPVDRFNDLVTVGANMKD